MESRILNREGNTLQVECCVKLGKDQASTICNSQQFICGTLAFEVKVESSKQIIYKEDSYVTVNCYIFVKFSKILKDDDLSYNCEIVCKEKPYSCLFSNDQIWHNISKMTQRMHKTYDNTTSINVKVKIDVLSGKGSFAAVYDDSEFTNFNLCGVGGSVPVHSVIMAAISPVMKTMLSGEWKEVAEGKINVADTTKETLEHFKEYVYLDKLPEEGIEPLLLLGSHYMIPALVLKCIVKLLGTLNDENFVELIDFARKCKIDKLFFIILSIVENGGLEIHNKLANM